MPSSVTSEVLTIDQIEVSPLNVRRHRATIESLGAMEASLLGSGLIQPLNVHPMMGSKKFGAFAGGRRCRAIRNLVARGDLPRDWPVRVEVYRGFTDVDIIELSLGENIPRADLEKYEICAAIRALEARKEPISRIANALGQPLRIVEKWQRVGQLAEPLFAAFAEGRISEAQAQAFAATTDQQLQLTVWEQLRHLGEWEQTPDKIHAALKVGDAELGRMLRFVGDAAYRASGGRFELDLFAGETIQRGRIVDEGLLRRLVDEQLADRREDLRRRTGRADLRFVPKPPQREHYGPDLTLRIDPGLGEGDAIVLPQGDIVGHLYISDAGAAEVDWWWSSRKAKYGNGAAPLRVPMLQVARPEGAALDDRASPGATRQANEEIRDETGLSPTLINCFRSVRRAVMRAMLVAEAREHSGLQDLGQGTLGLDYLVWAQLRLLMDTSATSTKVGMRAIGPLDVDPEEARPFTASLGASGEWREALAELRTAPFIAGADLAAAFIAYREAKPEVKQLAGAVVAGLALERSLASGAYDLSVHRAVAAECGVIGDHSFRRHWEPTAELLGLIPANHRLAIAEPFVERVTLGAWQRLKSAELTARVLELVTGASAAAKASMAEAARSWVHPLLGFGAHAMRHRSEEHVREAAE